MSLLNLFNRFTRNFRKKKRRKTRRRKGAGQGTYSDVAKYAMMNAAHKAGVPPRHSSSSESKSSSGSHKVRAPPGRRLERRQRRVAEIKLVWDKGCSCEFPGGGEEGGLIAAQP